MAMKKGLLFGGLAVGVLLVGCVGGCGLLGWWVYSTTAEAARTGSEFVALIGEGKIDEAYDSASSKLRDRQTREEFAASVKKQGLTDHASSNWPSRNVQNDEAALEGIVTTTAGTAIPMKMTLVKESGKWRVLTLATR